MNERQAFALTHPLTDPHADQALMQNHLTATRRHGTGLIVMSILAVDR